MLMDFSLADIQSRQRNSIKLCNNSRIKKHVQLYNDKIIIYKRKAYFIGIICMWIKCYMNTQVCV